MGGGNQTGQVSPRRSSRSTPRRGLLRQHRRLQSSVPSHPRQQGYSRRRVTGESMRGSVTLGNLQIVPRFGQSARRRRLEHSDTTRDTIIRRWMKALVPVDTTQDSVVFTAIGRDAPDSPIRRVCASISRRSESQLLAPRMGDSVQRGILMNVIMRVTSDQGISRATLRIRSITSATCPTG